MIHAVVNNGFIQPLEPLPAGWENGRELIVDVLDKVPGNEAAELDQWAREMNALTVDLNDPVEWQTIDATLAEADRHAKAQIRREMGLN